MSKATLEYLKTVKLSASRLGYAFINVTEYFLKQIAVIFLQYLELFKDFSYFRCKGASSNADLLICLRTAITIDL